MRVFSLVKGLSRAWVKMAKRLADSSVTREIKKEYLKKHLDSVGSLIERWGSQLYPPFPLAHQKGSWGWQSAYRPPVELDMDDNHVIRRHLRSRALWIHHANWERELDKIYESIISVRQQAEIKLQEQTESRQREYNENYLGTALDKAFDKALGREVENGSSYESYATGTLAMNLEGRALIEQEHWDLILDIAELGGMKGLADQWNEVLRLQKQMQLIVDRALKSNDILYPCRFCRHLWK